MACNVYPKLTDDQLDQLGSQAEAKFYKACRDQLPSSYFVFHSLSLVYQQSSNGKHGIGESDFVICNPNAGILVVEIKGGGIRYDPSESNHWYSIDRYGNEHQIKDPFEQSKNYQFRILDLVKRKARNLTRSHFPLGHSVAFPDVSNRELGRIVSHNRPREIIACSDDLLDLMSWYAEATKFWSGKEGIEPLGAQGIREIEKIMLAPVLARPSISSRLRDQEEQRIKLTDDQARLLHCLEHHTRVNITGGAGTGKTVLAKKLAEKFAAEGKRTALVCYNQALGEEIKQTVPSFDQLYAGTYHAFFRRILGAKFENYFREAKEAYPNADDWKVAMPFAFLLAIEEHDSLKFDAVVVDEGQDFSPEMWMSLEALLKDETSKLFVFSDTNQDLYSKKSNVPDLSPPFLLQTNCRNTKQIHERAYEAYEGPPILPPDLNGEKVEIFDDKSISAQSNHILSLLNELCSAGDVEASDIVILVANSTYHSEYFQLLCKASKSFDFVNEEFSSGAQIRVSTIKRFKGLEAPVLVVWGLQEVPEHSRRELHYVGVSRAKSMCFVIN